VTDLLLESPTSERDTGADPRRRTGDARPGNAPDPSSGSQPWSLEDRAPEISAMRVAAIGAIAAGGAAGVSGGLFQGLLATIVGVVAAAGGAVLVGLAVRSGRTWLQYIAAPGIFVLGYVAALILPNSTGVTGTVPSLVHQAISNGGLGKPPIPFDPGWRFLLVALIGMLAAGGVSLACATAKPRLAIAVPLPLIVAAALDQPPHRQLLGGVIACATLLLALSLSRGAELAGEAKLTRQAEARQLGRSLLAAAGCVVVLVVVNHASFLFPAHKSHTSPPQKPRVVPLSQVPDRPLFAVSSTLGEPWRLGVYDTYQGDAWLLPGYDPSRAVKLGAGGEVPGAPGGPSSSATVTVLKLGGFELPSPAGTQRVTGAKGSVQYDPRTETLRAVDGAPPDGYRYTVQAANTPSGAQLSAASQLPDPPGLAGYTQAPPAPVEVTKLLQGAPADKWDRLQVLRSKLYDTVVAAGGGLPGPVTPAAVVAMLDGGKANPFQIVAGEALLARWAGLPSRIGYGFFGGEPQADGSVQFRPRDGANWLEVYFPGYGWVPILGTPLHAQSSLGQTKPQPHILPSDQIQLQVYFPVLNQDPQFLFEEVRFWTERVLPLLAAAILAWKLVPLAARVLRQRRRRRWAAALGPAGRIAVAYCEFRDSARDLGVDEGAATPLEYLDSVVDDPAHRELAWLTTRGLWGDLARDLQPADADAAEALSRSLRRRMQQAQPWFVRLSAVTSRASLRQPWDRGLPNLWPALRRRPLARPASGPPRVPRRAPALRILWRALARRTSGVRA
jgi:hypothetical protein